TDLRLLAEQVLRMRPEMLLVLTALLAFNTFLSGEKWRLVDRRLHQPGEALPRSTYFGLTALGTMLGSFVPVPLRAAVTRSIGVRVYGGRALLRGTVATFFEQGCDVLAAVFLAVAAACLLLLGGSGFRWVLFALMTAAACLVFAGAATALLRRVA